MLQSRDELLPHSFGMRPTTLVLALILAAACSRPTESEWRRDMGTIGIYQFNSTPGVLVTPDTVRMGQSFQATVTTFGSSSCTRPDESEVIPMGALVEIIPFDLRLGGTCTDDLQRFPRQVTVMLPFPGRGVVRVRGRSLFGGTEVTERAVVVVR